MPRLDETARKIADHAIADGLFALDDAMLGGRENAVNDQYLHEPCFYLFKWRQNYEKLCNFAKKSSLQYVVIGIHSHPGL